MNIDFHYYGTYVAACYKDYLLPMVGMRMHVLADTWAHMYYIGMPAWFINDAKEEVYKIEGTTKTPVKWQRIEAPIHSLEQILSNRIEFQMKDYRPIALFKEYLKEGYYPYFQSKCGHSDCCTEPGVCTIIRGDPHFQTKRA